MLTNYLSSGSFFGSTLFVIGVWFGILRAHAIYQYKRSLLVLITLSTLGFPVLTHLLVTEGGYTGLSELQAKYAAIVGFLVSTIFAEFMMMLYGPSSARPVVRSRPQSARKLSPSVVTAKPVEVKPLEVKKPEPVVVQVKMIEEPLTIVPPLAKAKHSPARKPAPVVVQVDLLEDELPEIQVEAPTPTPVRKPTLVAAKVQTEKSTESTGDNPVQFGNWRLFLYFFIFLLIVLFPPYHETVTNSRAWLFITSINSKPFFAFDLAFLLYELIILSAVTAVYEFWRSQSDE